MTAKKKVDLAKLAPRATVSEISVGEVEISKLSVGGIASIMIKFPEIAQLLNQTGSVDISKVAGSAPDAVEYIIAMGTPGKLKNLEGIKSLDAADQLILLTDIFDNSFSGGMASFLDALNRAAGMVNKMQRG